MRKGYLMPIKIDYTAKTLKYVKSISETIKEHPQDFDDNKYVRRIVNNVKIDGNKLIKLQEDEK